MFVTIEFFLGYSLNFILFLSLFLIVFDLC